MLSSTTPLPLSGRQITISSLLPDHLSKVKSDLLKIGENTLYVVRNIVAMSSSLGPIFANLFLCYYEKLWRERCPLHFKPIMFRRYVDDTFLMFKEEKHAQLFFEYLNAQHSNIKFTMDKEHNNKLPFFGFMDRDKMIAYFFPSIAKNFFWFRHQLF